MNNNDKAKQNKNERKQNRNQKTETTKIFSQRIVKVV